MQGHQAKNYNPAVKGRWQIDSFALWQVWYLDHCIDLYWPFSWCFVWP